MKTIAVFALSMFAVGSSAWATPVEDMVNEGFVCDAGSRGEVICAKEGAPTKICNTEGSCFRIIRIDSASLDGGLKTGSLRGPSLSGAEY